MEGHTCCPGTCLRSRTLAYESQHSAVDQPTCHPHHCRSPRVQVTYSDRFIPSRAASSRLNFSVFDRETATSEVQKPPDKDVRTS